MVHYFCYNQIIGTLVPLALYNKRVTKRGGGEGGKVPFHTSILTKFRTGVMYTFNIDLFINSQITSVTFHALH